MKSERLKYGDEIRVIAPSTSLAAVQEDICREALAFLTGQGFQVTFSRHCRELDAEESSSVRSRAEDLHEAFLDKNVKAILACAGGFNVNQILEYLDYSIIKNNPKIICGYSDITALTNAIYKKTGLFTYHGPQFSSFGHAEGRTYTNKAFSECVMGDGPFELLPSEAAGTYTVIQEGRAGGTIIGGNLCTLNLLQGTPFMPVLNESILFLEDDNIMGEFFTREFERNFQSLLQAAGGSGPKGIVFGRFDDSCHMTEEFVRRMCRAKDKLLGIPILFGVDFGHVRPFATFPVGGQAQISGENGVGRVRITEH